MAKFNILAVVAFPLQSMAFPVSVTDLGCDMSGQQEVDVTLKEKFPTAFKKRIEVSSGRQNVPGTVYETESGFTPDGPFGDPSELADIGVADTGTRFAITIAGIPAGAVLTVPATVASGASNLFLQRITGFDPDFAGGMPTSDTSVTPSGGVATLLYEVAASDNTTGASVIDQFVVPVHATCSVSDTIDPANVQAAYAPQDNTMVMSGPAPEPRFALAATASPTPTDTPTVTATATQTASATGTVAATATVTTRVLRATQENLVPGGCSDGVDNDGDGLIDCADPDCLGQPGCPAAAPAPTASPGVVVAAVLLLGALAFYQLRWRRQGSRARRDRTAPP